ncbi:MAG: DUF2207 domain-containing protein [Eubacteriales bacterium]|nr:DUF2207 domain-containing protein [Eubacteriales bacterium]
MDYFYTFLSGLAGLVCIFFALISIWFSVQPREQSKTDKKSEIFPKDLDLAEIGYIFSRDTREAFLSLLPYWAEKRYLSISKEQKIYRINKGEDMSEDASRHEKKFFYAVFSGRKQLVLDKSFDPWEEGFGSADVALMERFEGQYALTVKGPTYLTWISAIALGIMCFIGSTEEFIFRIFVLFISPAALIYIGSGFRYSRNERSWKEQLFGSDGIVYSILLIVFITIFFRKVWQRQIIPEGFCWFCFVVSLIASLLKNRMIKLKKYGKEMEENVWKFRNFLRDARPSEIAACMQLNGSNLYELLSYAIALDLKKEWLTWYDVLQPEAPGWFISDTTFEIADLMQFLDIAQYKFNGQRKKDR